MIYILLERPKQVEYLKVFSSFSVQENVKLCILKPV